MFVAGSWHLSRRSEYRRDSSTIYQCRVIQIWQRYVTSKLWSALWRASALFISLWTLLTPIVEGKAQAIKLQAIAPITPDEQSQPKELLYHESSQDQRWLFFTRRDIGNQDTIAPLRDPQGCEPKGSIRVTESQRCLRCNGIATRGGIRLILCCPGSRATYQGTDWATE